MCESTGVVVAPYLDYPQLLGVLLRLLGETSDKLGVLRLLGVLGALDPHQHKTNQANLKVCYLTCYSSFAVKSDRLSKKPMSTPMVGKMQKTGNGA